MKLPILQAITSRHYGLHKPDQRERGESIVSYSRCRTSNVKERCNEVSGAGNHVHGEAIMHMERQEWDNRRDHGVSG